MENLKIICPNCGIEVVLDEIEKVQKEFNCPSCKKKIALPDDGQEASNQTTTSIEEILHSLSSAERTTAELTIYDYSFLEATINDRNLYLLRYHFNNSDKYYETIRNDITLQEARDSLLAFRNLKNTWRENFDWNEHPIPRQFKWRKRIAKFKRLPKRIIWIIISLLSLSTILGMLYRL